MSNATDEADDISSEVSDFDTYASNLGGYNTDLLGDASDIEDLCDSIDVNADDTKAKVVEALVIPDQIQNDIDAIYEYLDEIISGDCKANVVRVSILTLDSNGFYMAPSTALMSALKSYLDARKISVVHNSVVSGAYYLVKVKLDVEIAIENEYIFSSVKANVEAALDEMFKGRAYGGALKRSEYYGVVDNVAGVSSSNNSISDVAYWDSNNPETPPSVDSNGNLFIGGHEVITKWEINVVQIYAGE